MNEITEKILILQGKILLNLNKGKNSLNIHDYEFSVSSQWGEDGIIQFLIESIPIRNKTFIEFGVESYKESNTRFLLQNNNWSGLIIDGSADNINLVKESELYWRHSLTAVSEFITKDNINDLITGAGFAGEIGILSIDVDGNDYWILDAIDCVSPAIIIIEYNSLFGDKYSISVPYDKAFNRMEQHYSGLYWGASISALTDLALKKGYYLVGSNSDGVNLFFVKKELIGNLKKLTAQEAYVENKFRQSRNKNGALTFLSNPEGLKLLGNMQVVNLKTNELIRLDSLKNVKKNEM